MGLGRFLLYLAFCGPEGWQTPPEGISPERWKAMIRWHQVRTDAGETFNVQGDQG